MLTCGKVKIRFIPNSHLEDTPIQTINTLKSQLKISTPEGTAMDLLNYPKRSGGLDHIATVLTELQEAMKPDKLLKLVETNTQTAWKQRLGFLLEKVGANGPLKY